MPYSLEDLKERWSVWSACFRSKDRNAILNQLYKMIWNQAVWHAINETYRHAETLPDGSKAMNWMLYHFINDCFVESQFMAVRRITEKKEGLSCKDSVYSLGSLLAEMCIYSEGLTRANLFDLMGLDYDYQKALEKENAYEKEHQKEIAAGLISSCVPWEMQAQRVQDQHMLLDRICGRNESNRAASDQINVNILVILQNKIAQVSRNIRMLTHKYYAHAATPESRLERDADDIKVLYSDLWSAHKTIAAISSFISNYIFGQGHLVLMPEIFGPSQFIFLEKQFCKEQDIPALKIQWEKYKQEANSWGSMNWGDFERTYVTE